MPRRYVRKTNRGATEDELRRARDRVNEGSSIRAAANDFNIARMTLKRFIDKCNETSDQRLNEIITKYRYLDTEIVRLRT